MPSPGPVVLQARQIMDPFALVRSAFELSPVGRLMSRRVLDPMMWLAAPQMMLQVSFMLSHGWEWHFELWSGSRQPGIYVYQTLGSAAKIL